MITRREQLYATHGNGSGWDGYGDGWGGSWGSGNGGNGYGGGGWGDGNNGWGNGDGKSESCPNWEWALAVAEEEK